MVKSVLITLGKLICIAIFLFPIYLMVQTNCSITRTIHGVCDAR